MINYSGHDYAVIRVGLALQVFLSWGFSCRNLKNEEVRMHSTGYFARSAYRKFLNLRFQFSDMRCPVIWCPYTQTTRCHIKEGLMLTYLTLHLCHENKAAVWATRALISLEDAIDFHCTPSFEVQSVPHALVPACHIEPSRSMAWGI